MPQTIAVLATRIMEEFERTHHDHRLTWAMAVAMAHRELEGK
jgi:hypothetical protein